MRLCVCVCGCGCVMQKALEEANKPSGVGFNMYQTLNYRFRSNLAQFKLLKVVSLTVLPQERTQVIIMIVCVHSISLAVNMDNIYISIATMLVNVFVLIIASIFL